MKDYQYFRSKRDIKEWVTIYYPSYLHPLVENIDRVVGSNIDWYKNDVQALFFSGCQYHYISLIEGKKSFVKSFDTSNQIVRWILGNNWSVDEAWQEDNIYRGFFRFILSKYLEMPHYGFNQFWDSFVMLNKLKNQW